MAGRIVPRQFHDADGVEDWRVVSESACAYFVTGSVAASVALIAAIGRLADNAGYHPSHDLRAGSVTVRLTSNGIGGLNEQDVALAR